jgi:protein-tyrosine phosphatase
VKYAVLFLIIGAYLIAAAVLLGGPYWLLLWPGGNALLLTVGYLGLGPRFLGKRPHGGIAWWAFALMLPYFVGTWLMWHLQRFVLSAPACHEVAPRLWLGRRPLPHEIPLGTDLVVDLTAEFLAHPGVLRGRDYLCLPTLDCSAPDERLFRAAVERVAAWPGTVYLHCAAGHGRSATLAAAVLVARGLAPDADSAVQMLRSVRSGVGLVPSQRALLLRTVGSRSPLAPEAGARGRG